MHTSLQDYTVIIIRTIKYNYKKDTKTQLLPEEQKRDSIRILSSE